MLSDFAAELLLFAVRTNVPVIPGTGFSPSPLAHAGLTGQLNYKQVAAIQAWADAMNPNKNKED